jgi:hypothetical protein
LMLSSDLPLRPRKRHEREPYTSGQQAQLGWAGDLDLLGIRPVFTRKTNTNPKLPYI